MSLLLDTHIFFWVIQDSPRLRPQHRDVLVNHVGPVYVSAVSGWEIATKVRLGKWPEAAPLLPGLSAVVENCGLTLLPLTMAQAEWAGSFDISHKDPFDRLLAAQAIDLDLSLVTVDAAFAMFGCKLL
jgi:PIN domain nuclease of toxin-antitoxin system